MGAVRLRQPRWSSRATLARETIETADIFAKSNSVEIGREFRMPRGGKRPGAGRPRGSPNRPRGFRPPATNEEAALRIRAAQCVAFGMDPADIALALNVTELELRTRCEHELANGKAIVRAQLLADLSEAAAKGNSGAAKVLLAQIGNDGDDAPNQPAPQDEFTTRALRILAGVKK